MITFDTLYEHRNCKLKIDSYSDEGVKDPDVSPDCMQLVCPEHNFFFAECRKVDDPKSEVYATYSVINDILYEAERGKINWEDALEQLRNELINL